MASTTSPDDCHPEAGVAAVAWCGAVFKTDDKKLFKYFEYSDWISHRHLEKYRDREYYKVEKDLSGWDMRTLNEIKPG